MKSRERPLTIGGRVNEDQLALVDAAARLTRQPRSHFIVRATLEKAGEVIRRTATQGGEARAEP